MKRHLYTDILKWKELKNRKPLIVRGVRQVGKTTLIFEERKDIHKLFISRIDPKQILAELGLLFNSVLIENQSVFVFDEIQACPDALTSLKYFYEQMPWLTIIAAGSLLGVKFGELRGFPVGKVQFLDLYPLSFSEFLLAMNQDRYLNVIQNAALNPISDPVHAQLLRWLKEYLIVGGVARGCKLLS
jgi:predicted AAA+ superfamily ATPase